MGKHHCNEQAHFGGLSLQECRQLITRQNMLAEKFRHGTEGRRVYDDTQAVLEDLLNYVEEINKYVFQGQSTCSVTET